MPADPDTLNDRARGGRRLPEWLRSSQFLGPVSVIGGVALIASMDGPIAVFALPAIQNDLGLSDAGRNWVITAYLLTFGGLILLGGRLGDTIGRKRTFILGLALFTVASVLCGVAWNGGVLVVARLLHGAAAAVVTPTCMALVATTFSKGPARNAATAVFGAMASFGAVLGLALGGVLTGVSWRLAFLVNVPIAVVLIYFACTQLRETEKERMRLDVAGAIVATVTCSAAVFGLSVGPEEGWASQPAIWAGVVALLGVVVFIAVERTVSNPIVPFDLFLDGNRVATFMAMLLVRGLGFTMTVVIALYVQNVMGYTPLGAGLRFIPFTIAMALGTAVSSRLVMLYAPRIVVIAGAALVIASAMYGSTFDNVTPYFPDLVVPLAAGAFGLGLINVPLGLSLIASVGVERIGPTSAIAVMFQSLGGPLVLVAIQVIITTRTLQLGGTTGPAQQMSGAALQALSRGYAYGMLWLGGVGVLLCVVALFIRYTAQEVAHAQQARDSQDSPVAGA